jgi:hypothetical protein
LPLGFQIGFGDEVDYGAVFGEDLCKGGFERVGFYVLFEVADVDSVRFMSAFLKIRVRITGMMYVALGGLTGADTEAAMLVLVKLATS